MDLSILDIRKGVYGLPQAVCLENDIITERLAPKLYVQCTHISGLWWHKFPPILFSFVVEKICVKYVCKEHADHLISSIGKFYPVSEDWTGSFYCGITLKWDYQKWTVDSSMPGYVTTALYKYQHKIAQRQQHSPHKWDQSRYGANQRMVSKLDISPLLPK